MKPHCLVVSVVATVLVAGCTKPPAALAPTKPPDVVVDRPVVREVGDYEDFTGRTEPINTVDIRAQVTGYLEKVHFKDGADVPEGQPLFDIDPQLYKATYEQSKAAVTQSKARFDRVKRDFDRVIKLGTAASPEELDRATGDRAEAEAAVASAEATMRLAETNLGYTQIKAKFAGRLSKRMVDPGNIVKANETLLTSLVALDPIYAAFDIDERTILRARRLIAAGDADSARDKKLEVQIGLADEEGFSPKSKVGVITFIDNKVDPNTGTLRLRAEVTNKDHYLSPGLFVRVRIPLGRRKSALLISEEALGSDQGQKFVFIVNEKDEVVYRRVKTGQLFDGLRVIEEGVAPTDRIIVSGLQRVRQGVTVAPRDRPPAPPAASPPPPTTASK